MVLKKKIFKFYQYILHFRYYLPLEMDDQDLNKFEFLSTKDAFSQVWLKLAQSFLRRRFLNDHTLFRIFVIISPLKRASPE
jgi:hypothetical protein